MMRLHLRPLIMKKESKQEIFAIFVHQKINMYIFFFHSIKANYIAICLRYKIMKGTVCFSKRILIILELNNTETMLDSMHNMQTF